MTASFLAALLASAAIALSGDLQEPPDEPERPLAALAGDYYHGDGFSHYSLRITPDGRFLSETRGCVGVYDINAGRADVVDGHLILTPHTLIPRRVALFLRSVNEAVQRTLFPETRLSVEVAEPRHLKRLAADLRRLGKDLRELATEFRAAGEPTDLIPVRWGEQLHLVPRNEGPHYCNLVNLGWISRYPGRCFYLRDCDDKPKVEGLPSVPKEWKRMLLTKPIQGKIINVMADGRARIDLGAENGVWEGMLLESDPDKLEVVRVDAKSSVIKKSDRDNPPFKEGQGVRSTCHGW